MSRKVDSIVPGHFPQLNKFYYDSPDANRTMMVNRLIAPAVTTSLGLCIHMTQSGEILPVLRPLASFLRHLYLDIRQQSIALSVILGDCPMPLLETLAITSWWLDIKKLTSLVTAVGSTHLKRFILFMTSIALHRQVASRWIDSLNYNDWMPLVQALAKSQEGISPAGKLMKFCIVVIPPPPRMSEDDFGVRRSEAMQQFQDTLCVALKNAADLTVVMVEDSQPETCAHKYFSLTADEGQM
jgi:hypothetical protein